MVPVRHNCVQFAPPAAEPLATLSEAIVKLGVALAAIRSTVTDDGEFEALQAYVATALEAASELRRGGR